MIDISGINMKKFNALLVFLISSLAITGISFIDDKIWNVIFLIVGMIAYAIVGIMFSIGILRSKQAGKDAYVLVFFLLLLGGYAVYNGLEQLKHWVLAWPLFVKILVPSIIGLGVIAVVVLIILVKKGIIGKKSKLEQSPDEKNNLM